MVNVYLHGEDDPEVNDYEQYDNGTKIIASYLCEPQLINIDNYEILIDNGYYTEDEVKPETTPTPEPTVTPSDPTVTFSAEPLLSLTVTLTGLDVVSLVVPVTVHAAWLVTRPSAGDVIDSVGGTVSILKVTDF